MVARQQDRPARRGRASARAWCRPGTRGDRPPCDSSASDSGLPMKPGSSRTTASMIASAATSPPLSTKSPREISSTRQRVPASVDDALVDALVAAAREDELRLGARRSASALGERACRTASGRRHDGRRRCARRSTASSASPHGSGFITMPAPPPYGVSSTVRCRSWVSSRRSCACEVEQARATRLARQRELAAARGSPGRSRGRRCALSPRVGRGVVGRSGSSRPWTSSTVTTPPSSRPRARAPRRTGRGPRAVDRRRQRVLAGQVQRPP